MIESQLIAKRADHKTNHILHLILSIITGGLWVPVWILVAVNNVIERNNVDRKLGRLHG